MTTEKTGNEAGMPRAESPETSADRDAEPDISPAMLRRAVIASCAGSFVEYYDFAVYAALTPAIASTFFSATDRVSGLLSTLGIFALAFLARPLGGLIWGRFGDKIGRQTTLVSVIVLMSVSTAAIGLLPGYETIGVLAPLLLVILRVLQGISAGGELPGATIFVAESAPNHRRGYFVSWIGVSITCATLAGLLTAALLAALLSTESLNSWGWRIPFLLALPLGLVGLYIRVKLDESPAFELARKAEATFHSPLPEVLGKVSMYRRMAVTGLLGAGAFLGYYIMMIYMPTLLTSELGFDSGDGLLAICAGGAAIAVLGPPMGILSDRYGRRRVLVYAAVGLIVFTYPSFLLLDTGNFLAAVAALILLAIPVSAGQAVYVTAALERFPTSIRYTAFGISYNVFGLIGGTAAYVSTFLVAQTGTTYAPAFYLMAVAVVVLLTTLRVQETASRPLESA
ncbi:MFS transporter [Nocardia sp. NPDC019395]|uniref:MFS transporter n=1 Tax=Nocardia sp. NPDC019395 TaxID=3154686 RepID=UPI0033C9946D